MLTFFFSTSRYTSHFLSPDWSPPPPSSLLQLRTTTEEGKVSVPPMVFPPSPLFRCFTFVTVLDSFVWLF
ncbi:hypothetical protein Sjap_011259 [Stephania japonica]|uniref:Uncharacterized protein n=1 Tax=Stephania japonica TaxID=461633 RepID=A0AAP0JD66_9MAGN